MSDKQHSFNREDLLACSRGEMFGPGNSQLPAPNMLMMDRISHISEEGGEYDKGEIITELARCTSSALTMPFSSNHFASISPF